jgi:hypothetical protein
LPRKTLHRQFGTLSEEQRVAPRSLTVGVRCAIADIAGVPEGRKRTRRKDVLAMTALRSIAVSSGAALLAMGLVGGGLCSAGPPPSPPGPGEPGYCGAHTDGMDCWSNTGPETPGEAAFLNDVRGQVPGDDTTLLRNVRGICEMVEGGTAPSYIVSDIALRYGITNASAVQVMHAATYWACR